MIKDLIVEQLKKSAEIKIKLAELESDSIEMACNIIVDSFLSGGKVFIIGNGGSAADAQHIAGEWVAKFKIKGRRALPALALTTNTSILTSITNDEGSDCTIFSRQIEAFANHPSDIVIAITTSGNSGNILEAAKFSKERGLKVIGLIGSGGGKLKDIVDVAIVVPSSEIPRIQESHIAIGHIMCDIVEQKVFWSEEGATNVEHTKDSVQNMFHNY